MDTVSLFLNDLRRYTVRSASDDAGRFVVSGLPILRPGTFNGVTFTPEHLQEMADNLERQRAEMAFEPPLRPFHVQPGQPVDVRSDLLGNVTRAYVQDGVLMADAVVYDAATIERMKSGQYRYLSAEALINPGGPDGRTRLRGLAFVDDPACKGLPWELVMNRDEYSIANVEAPSAPEGGTQPMTMMDKVKQALGLLREATEETVDTEPQATAETETEPAEVTALREQRDADRLRMEELETQLREAQAATEAQRIDAEAAAVAAREAAVTVQVEALLSERYILPAQTDGVKALMLALGEQAVALSDGAEPTPLAELLATTLRQGAQVSAMHFERLSSNTDPTTTDAAEKAARMVARVSG